MGVYDTMVAGLSAAGLGLLAWVGPFGESDFHANAKDLETSLKEQAEAALQAGGFDWVTVSMNGQAAVLAGQAPDEAAIRLAEQAVLTSAGSGGVWRGGIVSVVSDFEVAPALPLASPYTLRAVKRPNGNLVLIGSVPSDAVKDALGQKAALISETVNDRTELARGMPSEDWVGIAMLGLDQLGSLDSGEARLNDTTLTVSGIALDDAARARATAMVLGLQEPWQGVAQITGPSLWRAEHVNGTLVLSGSCETAEDKAEIASIARANYSGPVIDEMSIIESPYDDWIDGVRLGLPHFSQFTSGEMVLEPEGEGFTFDGEATPSVVQFLREDMAMYSGEFGTEIAVEPISVRVDEIEGINLGSDPLIACQAAFDLVLQANRINFQSGSAKISRRSGEALDKVMAVSDICASSLMFEVAGHTDDTGSRDANIRLSRARAQAVADYMAASGFATERLIVEGYGPDRPISENMTPEGRAENRRIEFRIQEWRN